MRARTVTDNVVERVAHLATYDEAREYLAFHRQRYQLLIETVGTLTEFDRDVHILDVGPSFQTALLRNLPSVRVSTLGFASSDFPPRIGETHTMFDLNDAQCPERWLPPADYDGVVLAEVLEHLYTAPKFVLGMLARLVRPGGWLLVQTPNAVALSKRVKMLLGRHPFEPIRDDASNPGHFREYTLSELKNFGAEVGLYIQKWSAAEYFSPSGHAQAIYRRVASVLPSSMRAGFTVVYRRA